MKKRVLIVHPYLTPSGGGNVVAAWVIQALRDACNVSVATFAPVDCDALNRSFGTSLRPDDFECLVAPVKYQRMLQWMPTRGALLRCCVMMRFAQDLDRARHFDLLFSTENEADFNRRGLQYIHYPWLYLPRPDIEMSWFHRIPGVLPAYRFTCKTLGRASSTGLHRNLCLANSEFVAGKIRATYGVGSTVVYPPVPGVFPDIPWSDRKQGFVAIGRQVTSKRWEMAVSILDDVRRLGHDVTFTLIGHVDRAELRYAQSLQQLAQSRPWFRILADLSRDELAAEVASHRYGIHTMENEHFGIGPAELVRAGCVTFVHNSGGPIEIVGANPTLRFDDVTDAAAKISRTLSDHTLISELRAFLTPHRDRFTTDQFCTQIRDIVLNFVEHDEEPVTVLPNGRPLSERGTE